MSQEEEIVVRGNERICGVNKLTDRLSDFTVSAQTEPGTHWGCFNTGTEYLTFDNKKKKN